MTITTMKAIINMENVYYVTFGLNNQAQNSVRSIVIIMQEQVHVETNQSIPRNEAFPLSCNFAMSVAFITNLRV